MTGLNQQWDVVEVVDGGGGGGGYGHSGHALQMCLLNVNER